MTENLLSKHDIVVIDGVRFRVKYDFSLVRGDKNLLLIREYNLPKEHKATVARY